MEYFTEQAWTHQEAMEKIRRKYGEKAKILTHRSVRMGGFMGLFSKEGVEMTGYIAHESQAKSQAKMQEEKQKILDSVKNDRTLQQVLEEVQSLKQQLQENSSRPPVREEHPAVTEVIELMEQNEFSDAFISDVVTRMKSSLSMEELNDSTAVQEQVLEWIGDMIPIHQAPEKKGQRIIVLIGPTGVGKTTTVAKMAAIHSLGAKGERAKDVRLLTIDNYRIGAKQQIETYAEILQIPFSSVESYQDLQKRLAIYKDADLIMVDTIGKSPKDYMNLAKMREVLEGCSGKAEFHLAISSTTKVSDIKEVLQQFEPFGYQAVVLTKLDETMRIGNLISVLYEKGKGISYITNGQGVPDDIDRASVLRLLKTLEGFPINMERLRERFGAEEEEAPQKGRSKQGNDGEGITAEEQRRLYRYDEYATSQSTWGKK
jgi:flagellar biosynthesis protein FlhF